MMIAVHSSVIATDYEASVTRTWSAELENSDFNNDYLKSVCGPCDNTEILAPCMELPPGGTVYIRVENEMDTSKAPTPMVSPRVAIKTRNG